MPAVAWSCRACRAPEGAAHSAIHCRRLCLQRGRGNGERLGGQRRLRWLPAAQPAAVSSDNHAQCARERLWLHLIAACLAAADRPPLPPPLLQGQTQGKSRRTTHGSDYDEGGRTAAGPRWEPLEAVASRGGAPLHRMLASIARQHRSPTGRTPTALQRAAPPPLPRPTRTGHGYGRGSPPVPGSPLIYSPQVPMEPIPRGEEHGRGGSVYGQSEFAG